MTKAGKFEARAVLFLASAQVLVRHARILCAHAFNHGHSQDDAFRLERDCNTASVVITPEPQSQKPAKEKSN